MTYLEDSSEVDEGDYCFESMLVRTRTSDDDVGDGGIDAWHAVASA